MILKVVYPINSLRSPFSIWEGEGALISCYTTHHFVTTRHPPPLILALSKLFPFPCLYSWFFFFVQAHIRTFGGRIAETILSLRFFIFQYGIVYRLDVKGTDTSLTVTVTVLYVCVCVCVRDLYRKQNFIDRSEIVQDSGEDTLWA